MTHTVSYPTKYPISGIFVVKEHLVLNQRMQNSENWKAICCSTSFTTSLSSTNSDATTMHTESLGATNRLTQHKTFASRQKIALFKANNNLNQNLPVSVKVTWRQLNLNTSKSSCRYTPISGSHDRLTNQYHTHTFVVLAHLDIRCFCILSPRNSNEFKNTCSHISKTTTLLVPGKVHISMRLQSFLGKAGPIPMSYRQRFGKEYRTNIWCIASFFWQCNQEWLLKVQNKLCYINSTGFIASHLFLLDICHLHFRQTLPFKFRYKNTLRSKRLKINSSTNMVPLEIFNQIHKNGRLIRIYKEEYTIAEGRCREKRKRITIGCWNMIGLRKERLGKANKCRAAENKIISR